MKIIMLKIYRRDDKKLLYEYYFISDEGSRILMYYFRNREDEEMILPALYAESESTIPLSNCHIIKSFSDDYSYMYCDITKEEQFDFIINELKKRNII